MTQLSFNFDINKENIDNELIICHSNLRIFQFLDQYKNKKDFLPNVICLIGGKNSGKTSFLKLWQDSFNAHNIASENISKLNEIIQKNHFYFLDDICQNQNPDFLFHLINIIAEKSAFLLMSSSQKLANLNWQLADLNSRIKNIHQLEIENPDDDLVKILLTKYFAKKQLKIDAKIIDYLSRNIQRDFNDIFKISQLIEQHCYKDNHKITIPFLKKILPSVNNY